MATVRLKVLKDSLSPRLKLQIGAMSNTNRMRIMGALGGEFLKLTKETIGPGGKNRPSAWPRLSKHYADTIGRDDATLLMTGGERARAKKDPGAPHLLNKTMVQSVGDKKVVVGSDVAYATRHQYGNNMPERPYYPVEKNNRPTIRANNRLMAVLKAMVKKIRGI